MIWRRALMRPANGTFGTIVVPRPRGLTGIPGARMKTYDTLQDARRVAREILGDAIDPHLGCGLIGGIGQKLNCTSALMEFVHLAHLIEEPGHPGFSRESLLPEILAACRELLAVPAESIRNDDHVLAFAADGHDQLAIHADQKGLTLLIHHLARIRAQVAAGECEHAHLMSDAWGGHGLTVQVLEQDGSVTHHVKIHGWTAEWAERHGLTKAGRMTVPHDPE